MLRRTLPRLIKVGQKKLGKTTDGTPTLEVNGRTYGAKPNGTLYPIDGSGFHRLSRGAYKALGVINRFGDGHRSHEILSKMHDVAQPDIEAALKPLRTEHD